MSWDRVVKNHVGHRSGSSPGVRQVSVWRLPAGEWLALYGVPNPLNEVKEPVSGPILPTALRATTDYPQRMAFGSTPDWFHISEDEDIVWESRPHPITMGARLPVGIGLALAGLLVTGWSVIDGPSLLTLLGFGLLVVGVAVAFSRYLVWTNTRYVITSSELYKKRGIISRDVTQFRLERVQNTSLSQSGLGRLLGYGDLTVYTAGSGDPELTFERVPNPEVASSRLSDQLEAVVTDESAL